MNATIDVSYNQLLLLLQQMPVRAQLRLGKALTNQSIRAELDYFLDVFRTDEISEEDILAEVKAVRHERHDLSNMRHAHGTRLCCHPMRGTIQFQGGHRSLHSRASR